MQIAAVGERAPAEINLSGNDRLVGDTSQHEIRHDIWKIMRGRVTVQIASAVTPNSNVCSRAIDNGPRERSRRQAAPPWMRNQRLAPIPGKQKRGQACSLPLSLSLAVPD